VVAVQRAHREALLRPVAVPQLVPLSGLLPLLLRCPHPHPPLHRLYPASHLDSWNQYQYSLVQPVLSFQNYQASCLLQNGSVTYDSTFANELTPNTYQTFVSAGADGTDLAINAVVQSGNASACSLLLYFQVSLLVTTSLPRTASPPLLSCRCSSTEAQPIARSLLRQ